MDSGGGHGPFVATAEPATKASPPSLPAQPSGPLPKGKITEAQVAQFPQVQPMICGACGRRVPTPKGVDGVIVTCGGCGGEIEAIPF